MTQFTTIRPPCNLIIVAGAAKLAIGDVAHQYLIGASAHLEAKLGVADITSVTNPVKPVWKDNWLYTLDFRALVQHYIPILAERWRHAHLNEQE